MLVLALLMLVFLTLIGLSATTTTQIEIQIARNEEFHKVAFFNADSGVYAAPKIIRKTMDDGIQPTYSGLNPYLDSVPGNFYREVMGFNAYDAPADLQFPVGNFNVDVDVRRSRQQALAGGGAEFASGAEGIGVGSTGGVAVVYGMDSLGSGPAGSLSGVSAEYRYLPGVAGGL
ncbi:MAG: hypothetical protein AB1512_30730 [Thermodesulfobacteriota bacterium]